MGYATVAATAMTGVWIILYAGFNTVYRPDLCHYKLRKIKIKNAAGRCGCGEGCVMKWR
jgi:hypothetical protein